MTGKAISSGLWFALISFWASTLSAQDWKPVNRSELEMTGPVVEKDAPAEAIFWEVTIRDMVDIVGTRTLWSNYVRIKLFSQLGVEQQSKVEIPYFDGTEVRDIQGRTIKPDGSIVVLQSNSITDRTLVQAGRRKYKVMSFVLPAAVPGAIIEYRWTEKRKDTITIRAELPVQRDLPIQTVRYRVRPADLEVAGVVMKWHAFNMPNPATSLDAEKFWNAVATNVPAFHPEPYMPPEDQERQWLMLYYEEDKRVPIQEMWNEMARSLFQAGKNSLKFNSEVRRAAAAAVGDAATDEEKLRLLYDFCRTSIKRTSDDASGLTPDELKKMKENRSAADVLKRRAGTSDDILQLFGAMASSLRMDARYARVGDRSTVFFRADFPHPSMLPGVLIAVKTADGWRLFDPSSTYVSSDMLPWQHEGISALVADPAKALFVTTPVSSPQKSAARRTATMRLLPDGVLEGDVRVEFTGHLGAVEKEDYDNLAPVEREERLRDGVRERLGGNAEITQVQFSNIRDASASLSYTYHVRVPDYAQKTGRRMFFQPGYFEKGIPPMFSATTRVHPIYFQYPYVEEQEVTIEMPEGFELDNPDAPAALTRETILKHDISIQVSEGRRAVRYYGKTAFTVPILFFRPSQYSGLKELFDLVYSRANHPLTLRQVGESN